MEVLGIIFLALLFAAVVFGLPWLTVVYPELKENRIQQIRNRLIRAGQWQVEQYQVGLVRQEGRPDEKRIDGIGFRLIKLDENGRKELFTNSTHIVFSENQHALAHDSVDFQEKLAEYRAKAYELCDTMNASERLLKERQVL
jgi:hypothetical protein